VTAKNAKKAGKRRNDERFGRRQWLMLTKTRWTNEKRLESTKTKEEDEDEG
jgi:hypothetical protein